MADTPSGSLDFFGPGRKLGQCVCLPGPLLYSTNHVHLHRPNAFGFWQTRLHLCYETLKRVSNFSELA